MADRLFQLGAGDAVLLEQPPGLALVAGGGEQEQFRCDELVATEILFYNVLEPLNPPEAAGVLSALVYQVYIYFVCSFVCFLFVSWFDRLIIHSIHC